MSHKRSRRSMTVLGTAAGAVLAAGLIPLAVIPVALADGADGGAAADPDFISNTTDFGLFTNTDAADPDDSTFVADVIQGPMFNGQPLFTDILTSGTDPEDGLAGVPGLDLPGDTGVGMAGETVNTFIVPSDPALDSTFSLPFTDPLAELFTLLVQLGL